MGERLDLLSGRWVADAPKRKRPEAAVARAVDDFLGLRGVYVRQINSGGNLRGGKWTSSGQGAGISDRLGVIPGGRACAIELKAPGKKRTVTDAQLNFLLKYAKLGAVACVADSVAEVELALKSTKEEMIAALERLRKKARPSKDTSPLFP